MKVLLALTAVREAVTGLVLLVYPPIVVRLLFGADMAGVALWPAVAVQVVLAAGCAACLWVKPGG
jgi:hypothetical protein